jgi:hypothetical protein
VRERKNVYVCECVCERDIVCVIHLNFTLLWYCESVCVKIGFCVFLILITHYCKILRVCVWKQVFACFLILISHYCEIVSVCVKTSFCVFSYLYFTILWNGKIIFAKLKNFFAKLIFSRQIFFCSERFPFSRIPKKDLAGKKST